MAQIFEGLTQFDQELMLTPALAESWESDDLKVYSFVLRPDLRWSDGTPLTAADVAKSFESFMRDAKDWSWVLEPIRGAKALRAGKATTLEGVEVVDERHLRITLEEPDGLFLHLLALVPAAIYKRGEAGSLPVGAGPWRVFSNASDLVLEPNPHHYGPKAEIDQLIFRSVQSSEAFKSGRSHVFNLSGHSVGVPGKPLRYPGLNTSYAVFAKHVPADVRVIVNRVLNRKQYCAEVLRGDAVPARGVLPPGMPGHRPELPSLSAGEIPALKEEYFLSAQLDAELFKALKSALSAHKVKLVAAGDKPASLVQHGWIADYPDPDNFLRVLLHSASGGTLNYGGYSNPEFDRLVTQARRMSADLEQGTRMDLYQQAEDLVLADMPWLFLWHQSNVIAVNSRVEGLRTCANDNSGYLELPQTTLRLKAE